MLALLFPAAITGCHHKQAPTLIYNPPPAVAEAPPTPIAGKPPAKSPPPVVRPPIQVSGQPISTEVGLASWYGPPYHNRPAADGSIFDQNALTVAHRTLPMGTIVRVTNLSTGEQVVARVTDRGPFVPGRTLDLSLAAAKAINVYRAGVARVRIEAFARPGADPEGKWCVQIGSLLTVEDAIQLKNDLARRYAAAKVIEFEGPTGFWVRINPTPTDHLTATRIADTIHIPDAEAYLVRLN